MTENPTARSWKSQLRKSYDDGRIEALRGVDLSIEAADYIAISGTRAGSGKSTSAPVAGRTRGADQRTGAFQGQRTRSNRSRQTIGAAVGFIFQAFHLIPTLRAD